MRRLTTTLLIIVIGGLVLWEVLAQGTRTWVKYGLLKQPLPSWPREPRPCGYIPARGNSRQGAANTPPGGQAVLRALDNYQMFTGRLLMRSLTTSLGKAGLPG
jgi:hypothetical protein